MKLLVLCFVGLVGAVLPIKLSAAPAYRISNVDLKTDSTFGTFLVSTTTYGAIVGIGYTIDAQDSGRRTRFTSDFWLDPPRLTLPTVNQLRTMIRNDAVSKGAKAKMDADLVKVAIDIDEPEVPIIAIVGEDPGF